jgi:hypothetical protein
LDEATDKFFLRYAVRVIGTPAVHTTVKGITKGILSNIAGSPNSTRAEGGEVL